jgi:uncharacterized membrane protein YcaP (DUF421 family)
MLFDNGYGLIRILVVAPLAYALLVVMLRVSGKRTLSKMNAFDFVVTVALGSMLASTILTESVALAEGILGMGALILLQFVITWLSVRSRTISDLVKAEPTLLYHDGRYITSQMMRCRVTESEVQAAIRSQGQGAEKNVVSVVLETDGSFSVISSLPESQDVPLGVTSHSRER